MSFLGGTGRGIVTAPSKSQGVTLGLPGPFTSGNFPRLYPLNCPSPRLLGLWPLSSDSHLPWSQVPAGPPSPSSDFTGLPYQLAFQPRFLKTPPWLASRTGPALLHSPGKGGQTAGSASLLLLSPLLAASVMAFAYVAFRHAPPTPARFPC